MALENRPISATRVLLTATWVYQKPAMVKLSAGAPELISAFALLPSQSPEIVNRHT